MAGNDARCWRTTGPTHGDSRTESLLANASSSAHAKTCSDDPLPRGQCRNRLACVRGSMPISGEAPSQRESPRLKTTASPPRSKTTASSPQSNTTASPPQSKTTASSPQFNTTTARRGSRRQRVRQVQDDGEFATDPDNGKFSADQEEGEFAADLSIGSRYVPGGRTVISIRRGAAAHCPRC
jgi:hypothetical protein